MSSFFDKLDFSETLGQIRDKAGLKIVDVYTYRKPANGNPQIMPFLPTPEVDYITKEEVLESGGVISVGDILLKQIPISRYSEDDLSSSTSDNSIKHWILVSSKGEPRAYTTGKIIRSHVFWEVILLRAKAFNSDDIKKLLEGLNG